MSWKQIKREGIVVKFRKLLAMVLAVAMIASLAPVLRTTAKAEATWTKVEWTWDKRSNSDIKAKIDFGSTGKKDVNLTYQGISYTAAAKLDSSGKITITVPDGGGDLLVAYGYDSTKTLPGVKVKKTIDNTEISGSGIKSTENASDNTYIFKASLAAGIWELQRENSGEPWVVYISLSPAGPGVSSEIDSDSLKLEKDESGNFSGSATATVTVSNYEGDNWEFKAISADDSKVKVTFAEATKDSDVNGTYTLTITPVKDAETGEVNIYAGVVTKGKTPTKAEDFDKCATIPVTISQKSSTGGGGTGGSVTYHLNIPSDAKIDGVNNADDYLYVDSDPSTVKELHDNDITDFRVGGTGAKALDNDKLKTYKTKSMIGDYYFVGWSKTKVEKLDGESYKNIDFPVVNMEDDKSTNHRFIYVDTSIKGKYSTADITDLYAVWTTENNSGLFGYTMQLPGATFPGVDYLSTAPDNWHISGTNTRLGDNGTGGNKTWQKFTVLDEGHKNDDNKPLTVEVPNTQVINSDGTWNFSGWFNKAVAKSGDRNKDYLYAPDGLKTITGAAKTVLYSGNHAIYSLDAIWSRVTAPVDQTVLYKEDGNKPSFDGLGVKLVGGKYNDSDQKNAWENIFGTGSYSETDKTVTNTNLEYFVTVTGPGTIPAGFDGSVGKTLSEVQALTLTKPGKYTIEVHAKLEGVDGTNSKGGTATSVNFDFGTITFTYTIIPQLTVEVTKELTGRDWKPGESFIFNVEADNSATVKDSPITITKADDHKSAVVSFGEITEASGYREYKITITETTSGETGMDYADSQTITVTLYKAPDGTYTLSGANLESDGNYKTAVTMTNAYKSGSLTVTKEVAPSNTSKGAGPFTITVTLTKGEFPNPLGNTGDGSATRDSDTQVTLTLQKGQSVTLPNLPVGAEYTVEETESQGATVSYSVTGGSGTIAAGNSNNVTVTNTYPAPTGKLTITKTVKGTNAPSEWSFEFTVKAPSGVTFDAGTSYGTDATWVDANNLRVTVSNSNTDGVTIENLPIGTYTVTETDVDGYELTAATGSGVTNASGNAFTATITEDGTTTAAVTNTFLTGDLTINKTVTGTNAPASDTFTFTVKAADDATKAKVANETFDSVHFDANGVSATVTITTASKAGSVIIKNLPIGEYTVTEQDKDHYTPKQASQTVNVTTSGGTANFTNTYDQPTGSLKITKTVEGVASASGQEFTFTVTAPSDKTVDGTPFTVTGATAGTITFSGGTATVTVKMDAALTKTVTIAGLPIGYYKVEEKPTSPDNYNTSYAPTAAPSTGVNVTESGGEVTVTNTHKTGTLTISKTVTGSGPAVPTNGTFTFTIRATGDTVAKVANKEFDSVHFGSDGSATVTVSVSGGTGSTTIENLPIGTYTVTETVPAGYQVDGDNPKSVSLTTSGATAEFINTYQTGTLKITKTVDGIASASGKEFTFTITAPADKIADGTKFTVTGASDITFNGDKATVTIVMGTDLSKTVTIANLPAGEYTVKETAMADNYTVDGADSKTVTIRGGNTEIVAITNKHDTGDLTITKNVTGGTNVKVSQTFTFTVKAQDNLINDGANFNVSNGAPAVFNGGVAEVTVTLSNSDTGSVTIEGLPVGQYMITEKDVPTGYTASRSENVTVAKGTTPATATITNTVQTTSLTIGKTVVYPTDFPADKKLDANVVEYTFTVTFKDFPAGVTSFELTVGSTSQTVTTANNTVTFTLKENGSQTLAGVPGGIGFEVTEAFQSDEQGRHFTTEWFNRTGVVESDTEVNCTNTYHMLEKGNGALVIRKVAVGGQADTKYQFKVTFTQGGSPYTGQIGGKTLGSDGSAIFEMDDTANHSLVIQVPVGVAYKVEEVFASGERPKAISVRVEQNEAGDSTSGETASGTISQEFNYDSVIFTNRYLGDLTISKTVSGVYGGEVFTFTVTLPTGTYDYIDTKSGAKLGTISSGGTVTLKAGEAITIQNLPAGSSYTVTEAGTANYKTESVGAAGTIANNTTAEAAFTNNRNTGSLTVTKTLTGKLATSNDTFTFKVTLTGVGAGFDGDCGGVKFEDGVGTITITGAGSETISGLPVGAGFTVKEQDAAGYVTTYNNDPANHDKAEGTISANPTTVTVNNDKPDTGTITIKKVVKNAPAANANKEFNFTITLYLDEDLTEVATDVNGEHSGFNFTNGVASFTLKNGDSVIGEGEVTVSEGRLFYKIEETADPNYTTTSTTSDANGNSGGSVVTGEFTQDSQNTIVTFTNTYNYGDLTITKKVTDDSGASHASDKFTFTITKKGDSTFNQKVEITGANSDTVSLPAGDYIVTETAGMGDSVAYQVGTSGASAANAEVTITAGGTVTVTVTNTYYSGGGTGGTGGGTGGTPSPDIDTSEHYGYIIGVTHTEVAPEQNITRAEIATILFRLLTDEARAANWSENSGFPDVKSGVWYNHAVAVLHKMGIILGDDNGNFNPDQNITRAEVAAMVVRFYEVAEGTVLNNRFTDVETTKWYAEAVLLADYYGLMQGDGDTFKPEDLLTRAEAMTVFNRLLGRKPHKDHLHKDMITWTDNTDRNKWYYAEVQEATNSHTCGNNVVIDGKIYETWSAITKMRDWAALEY